MKWLIQILCVGVLIAVWVPTWLPQSAPPEVLLDEPATEELVFSTPPESLALPDGVATTRRLQRPPTSAMPSEALIDSLINARLAEADQVRGQAEAAPTFVGSANEWLTLLCSLVSLITFVFQARDWRRKKEA